MAKNDAKVKELMGTIEAKRAALGTRPRMSLRTNGLFKYDDSRHLNINVSIDKQLIDALGFLLSKHYYQKKAMDIFNIEADFEWMGFSFDDWVADFKSRIAYLVLEKENKKLLALEKKLATLFSEEATTEIELENIARLLK